MREIWKDIDGYDNLYQISDIGRVRSTQKWRGTKCRILSDRFDSKGYKSVILYNGNKPTNFKVHKLVAIMFLGHVPDRMKSQVDHIDNDRTNNHVDNLQILTNEQHRIKTYTEIKSTSKYIGVSWDMANNKWRASISINKKQYNLGRFTNELDAYKAVKNASNIKRTA